jgi:hypothetical protein
MSPAFVSSFTGVSFVSLSLLFQSSSSPVSLILFVVGAAISGLAAYIWYVNDQRSKLAPVGTEKKKKLSKKKQAKEARSNRATFVE